jgi:hypothetical protein
MNAPSLRALSLKLSPAEAAGVELDTYTYDALAGEVFDAMAESVYFDIDARHVSSRLTLSPDEARVLANQLLQVADQAEEARDRRVAFEHIQEELRDADEHGGPRCLYAHPDVHYVPAEQIEARVAALEAAGRRRYIVLADPHTQPAASQVPA